MFIKKEISRRGFLFHGALAAGALATHRVWAAPPPSRTVTMAIIGAGGRGRQMLPVFLNQPGVRFLAACDAVTVLQEAYTRDCMMKRNRYMVDQSALLVACYAGTPGGTRNTMLYAERVKVQTITIEI